MRKEYRYGGVTNSRDCCCCCCSVRCQVHLFPVVLLISCEVLILHCKKLANRKLSPFPRTLLVIFISFFFLKISRDIGSVLVLDHYSDVCT